ncbi:hypothetical protein [Halorubrum laminariae]|uniref:Uncharacterized protein n=1 Tax=Halorubrum laminariae TaxID=1433523 RepID=A0ABD6BWU1_9EURY|nr:hypothetical protein [Halorubrum laminariae]
MGDDDKTMVGTQISDERHKRWKQALQESTEFTSIAQAIRVGVEQVLFEAESNGEQPIDDERILSRLDELENEMIKTRAEIIETSEKTPTIEEISEEVVYRLADVSHQKKQEEGRY